MVDSKPRCVTVDTFIHVVACFYSLGLWQRSEPGASGRERGEAECCLYGVL